MADAPLVVCVHSVLQGVTGELRHGRMTAILGPSGSGKTTFLTTLAGKATYGKTVGSVFINGKADRISKFRDVVGFVPQEDVMLREMTVFETLMFSATNRLPASMSGTEKRQLVDAVIELLGLSALRYVEWRRSRMVRLGCSRRAENSIEQPTHRTWHYHNQHNHNNSDTPIGDEDVRGISGGQRKRVNVGMELVANPTVLFLDEPTRYTHTHSLSLAEMDQSAALRPCSPELCDCFGFPAWLFVVAWTLPEARVSVNVSVPSRSSA